MAMTRVTIIGGGASGVLLAAHLLRSANERLQVTLIEQRAELGAGVAYGTNDRSHLLNVRATNMSAFADDDGHFARWLQHHAAEAAPQAPSPFYFAPRQLYRDYLASLLAPHFASGHLERVRGTAAAIAEDAAALIVRLSDGRIISSDRVVIATGNEGARLPAAPWRYDGWQSAEPPAIAPAAPVVMIGTGLTMIDWALSLLNAGHQGSITAISPHGLLAHAHLPTRPLTISAADVPLGQPMHAVTRWIRGEVRKAEATGGDWRSVIDAIRPHTQRLWQSFSVETKRQFLRHARPWWDQHRHRIAPAAAETIASARKRGQLSIVAARLKGFSERGSGVDVIIDPAKSAAGEPKQLYAETVFECRGRSSDITRTENPLLRALLESGQARPDPLLLGIDVTPECAMLDAKGVASQRLFAIGPLTSGVFWESVAVPDIRLQAARIAGQLAPHP